MATKTKKAGARATVPQRGDKTRCSVPAADGRPNPAPTPKQLDALRAELEKAELARERVRWGDFDRITKADAKIAEAKGRLGAAEVAAMPPAASAVAGLAFAEADIPLAKIHITGNHRELDDDVETARLARSIEALALQQRVGLRADSGGGYELIWGSRRHAAHRLLGRATIAAKVYPASLTAAEVEILRTVENFGRKELTHVERAIAVARTMDAVERTMAGNVGDGPDARLAADVTAAGGLHAYVGLQLGYPARWVQDNAYVSKLGGGARRLLAAHRIDVGHARELAKLGDPAAADQVAGMVARSAEGLGGESVARCRQMVVDRLRSLRGTPWRLDVAFGAGVAGCTGQACATCPFNSKADPDLFGGALADEPDAGFCRKEACFAAKADITAKEVQRGAAKAAKLAAKGNGFTASDAAMQQIVPLHVKPASAARAAKKEIEASAGGAKAGGGRKSDGGWKPPERTPQEKLDDALRKDWTPKAAAAVRRAVVSNPERVAALALLKLTPGFRDDAGEQVLTKLADAIAAAVAGDVGLLAKGLCDRAAKEAKKDRWSRTVNLPVVDGWTSPELLGVLAAGWGVEVPARPTLADFGGAAGEPSAQPAVPAGRPDDDDEGDEEADDDGSGGEDDVGADEDDEDPTPPPPSKGGRGKRPSLTAAAKRAKSAAEREAAAPAAVREYIQTHPEGHRADVWREWIWLTTPDAPEPAGDASGRVMRRETVGAKLCRLADAAGVAIVDGRRFGDADGVRRCRLCGCTDDDCRQCIAKTGVPCRWVEQDLCSACEPNAADVAAEPPAWDFVESYPAPLPAELANLLGELPGGRWDDGVAATYHGQLLDDAVEALRQQASAQAVLDSGRDEDGARIDPSNVGRVERDLSQLRTHLADLVGGYADQFGTTAAAALSAEAARRAAAPPAAGDVKPSPQPPFANARNRDAYEALPLGRVFDAHGLAGRVDGPAYASLLDDVAMSGVHTLGQLEDALVDAAGIADVFPRSSAGTADEVAAAVRTWFARPAGEAVAGAALATAELEDAYRPGVFPPDGMSADLQRVHDCRFGLPVTVAGRPLPHAVIAAATYSDVVVYTLQPVRPVVPPDAAGVPWGRRRSEAAHADVLPECVPLDGVRCLDRRGREYAFGPDADRVEVTRPRSEVLDHHARIQATDDVATTLRSAKRAPAKVAKRKGRAA